MTRVALLAAAFACACSSEAPAPAADADASADARPTTELDAAPRADVERETDAGYDAPRAVPDAALPSRDARVEARAADAVALHDVGPRTQPEAAAAPDAGPAPCRADQKRCAGLCVPATGNPTYGCSADSCERCASPDHGVAVCTAAGACSFVCEIGAGWTAGDGGCTCSRAGGCAP